MAVTHRDSPQLHDGSDDEIDVGLPNLSETSTSAGQRRRRRRLLTGGRQVRRAASSTTRSPCGQILRSSPGRASVYSSGRSARRRKRQRQKDQFHQYADGCRPARGRAFRALKEFAAPVGSGRNTAPPHRSLSTGRSSSDRSLSCSTSGTRRGVARGARGRSRSDRYSAQRAPNKRPGGAQTMSSSISTSVRHGNSSSRSARRVST